MRILFSGGILEINLGDEVQFEKVLEKVHGDWKEVKCEPQVGNFTGTELVWSEGIWGVRKGAVRTCRIKNENGWHYVLPEWLKLVPERGS